MAYDIEFVNKRYYLHVVASGEGHSFEDTVVYTEAILAELGKTGLTRVLLDERSVSVMLTAHDAIRIADKLVEKKFTARGYRIANLYAPHSVEIIRAYETAFRNRSFNYKMFTDEDQAAKWLTA